MKLKSVPRCYSQLTTVVTGLDCTRLHPGGGETHLGRPLFQNISHQDCALVSLYSNEGQLLSKRKQRECETRFDECRTIVWAINNVSHKVLGAILKFQTMNTCLGHCVNRFCVCNLVFNGPFPFSSFINA